ncbi:type IV pilin N-terminal domain-containing protein [Natronomonas sp. LN261]|uniref:type IV pilin N-terminal domain-containing protein n=1 Tax=Natronomonas sp. LN261 TaxID=2750669 RepID=UPI0015EEBCCD|nr:type IV pilin N-terminal domain-containing protein [Natronomonas sp. LN261]
MRDRTAVAALLIGLAAAAGGGWFFVATLSTDAVPEADFEVTADAEANELTVEHAGGETITSGSLRILVYEDRPAVPDRTVQGRSGRPRRASSNRATGSNSRTDGSNPASASSSGGSASRDRLSSGRPISSSAPTLAVSNGRTRPPTLAVSGGACTSAPGES